MSVELFFNFGFLPKDKEFTVLEVGCGTATHYPHLHEKYPQVKFTGLDISNFATAFNKRYKFANFLELDLNKEDIVGEWDYVISSHTFEHLDDPVAAVEKCRKVAKEKVIISVPFDHYWNYDEEHIHKFTVDEPFKDYESHYLQDCGDSAALFYAFKGYAK